MRLKVEFEIDVPNGVVFTDEQMDEWLRWAFRDIGTIQQNNPLEQAYPDPEPVPGTFDYHTNL